MNKKFVKTAVGTKRITLVFTVLLLLVITSESFSQYITDEKAQKMDELISKYVEYGKFNGSVLVAEKGKIILEKGYGMYDFDKKLVNAPDTRFEIGSITKQFTSMIIMKLYERGQIDLNGKLSDYLPYYRKDNADKITIHNLLTHTSGIPNYTDDRNFMQSEVTKPITPKDLIVNYCSKDLEFEPGSKFNYSNSGYIILGAVIEEITGKKYKDVLNEEILMPLAMYDTGYEDLTKEMPNRALGYDRSADGLKRSRLIDMTIPFAAGAMYSTVQDLYKWDRALYSEKLISNKSKEIMWTPFLRNYAYGWTVNNFPVNGIEKKLISHSGGIFGFVSNIARVSEDDLVIIALSNFGAGQSEKLSEDAAKIIYDIPYTIPKRSLSEILMTSSKSKGVSAAVSEFRELAKDKDMYEFREGELNNFGYMLLQSGTVKDAIEVFKLNVEMFPESPNVYDSLGESYMNNGDKELAIKNYKKVLELDPKNENAANMLKKLESK
ncbi:hypothetical protein BH10BAC5_BH10BAC5_27650 [soil metagenome]